MTALIPYKHDPHNGLELRYAIRSLVKHFKPLTDITVIGDLPGWYLGKHIFHPDTPKRKEYSIYSKLMQVQDRVLYTNDDFFALKDFDESLPNYYSGTCGSKVGAEDFNGFETISNLHWLIPMCIDREMFENSDYSFHGTFISRLP